MIKKIVEIKQSQDNKNTKPIWFINLIVCDEEKAVRMVLCTDNNNIILKNNILCDITPIEFGQFSLQPIENAMLIKNCELFDNKNAYYKSVPIYKELYNEMLKRDYWDVLINQLQKIN